MADEDTRLDAVKVEDNTFYYIYTLVHVSPGEFSAKQLNELLRPLVLRQSYNMRNLKSLVQAGATIAFTYKDKNEDEIYTIFINKNDCKKL
ncbi:MAG: hypothetical protein ABUK01_16510 [Leptospirales bacterium]